MKAENVNILTISNNQTYWELLRKYLSGIHNWQMRLYYYSNSFADLAGLKRQCADIILVDYQLGSHTGLEVLNRIREIGVDKPIIMLAEKGDENSIVEVIRAGADDYLRKDNINADTLTQSIVQGLERYKANKFHAHACQKEGHLAYHDYLTNLPNRKLFLDRMHQALTQGRRNELSVAVLFIDLDGFKMINDTYGHSSGDLVLKRIANRLRGCIRESDTIGRFGGDEFVVMLNGVAGAQDAALVAEKILLAISAGFKLQDHRMRITASIGISLFPSDGYLIETLLNNADHAMYRAKQFKNSFKFYRSYTNDQLAAQLNTERNLNRAMKRNEFILFYQPVVDTSVDEIRSLEALIRWRQPEAGIVLPNAFLPIAESSGFMFRLNKWVMRAAFLQALNWRKYGHKIKISLNISNRQIQVKGLPLIMNKVLKNVNGDPEHIIIEIEESCLNECNNKALINIKKIKDCGFGISIDNFGKGFSSMSILNGLPVDSLKIDNSLVKDIAVNSGSRTIIKAIVDMARGLRFNVIAKGVETIDQKLALYSVGCDQHQGYLYSPAVNNDDAGRLLEPKTNTQNAVCQSVNNVI